MAITLTDAAANRVTQFIANRGKGVGLRLGVRTTGCSGMAYTMEFVDQQGPHDEIVNDRGVTVLIDPKAIMFLIGTVMDYVDGKLQAGFVFNNPNEKGRCGCGESFHV